MISLIEENILNAINPDLDNMGVYYTGTHIEGDFPYILISDEAKAVVVDSLKEFYGFDNVEWMSTKIAAPGVHAIASILKNQNCGIHRGKTGYLYAIMYTPPIIPKPSLDLLGKDNVSISKPYMDAFTPIQESPPINSYRNLLIRWKSEGVTIGDDEIAEVLTTIETALRNHKEYEPKSTARPMFVMAVI